MKALRLFACLLFAVLSAAAQDARVVAAINEIDPALPPGQQPYEMTWIQREESPHTLVDFEDLTGWRVELEGGATGEMRRSQEQQMWGQYVARIRYSGARRGDRLITRPPQPVPIPGRFDSVEMWAFGDRRPAAGGDTVDLFVLVEDARGREHRIQLTDMRWQGWWLVHRMVPAALGAGIAWPARFSGIEVAMGANPDPRYVFCDSLAFYTEELKPLSFKPQPKRNLRPFRGQNVGLNTGPGTLPFPTREETILPSNFTPGFQVSARATGSNQFEFAYRGRDAAVVYRYRPQSGGLGEIAVEVDGGSPFRPLEGGGLRLRDTPPGQVAAGQLVSAALQGDIVTARFRAGSRDFEYQLRLWQKSLVLDVFREGGDAVELVYGRVAGVRNPRLITVPYITYSHFNPRVLMSGEPSRPLFTSIWFDWYRSNASEPFFVTSPAVAGDSAEINGGLRYIPKTDGRRNDLAERVFLTVSPVYEETLPTVPNPPSLRRQEGKQVVWTVAQPETFQKDHQHSLRIRSYGLDKIMQHSHEVTWRDHADSYTMRLHAAPQKGGDKMLAWYIKAQNDMGWLQGVYSNYCDFAPVNTNWNPDFVQRMPDGEWRRAWYRTYAMKPAKAVEMDEYYARRIKERYGVTMSYTDVHTDNPPPWAYCDYDARVPGAGTFAATFYAYGQLLLNDQAIYGPTQSESTFQWLFAGLQSGGYGWVYTDVNLLTHPLDVAFRIHKLNPLECDYGMGYTDYYLSRLDKEWKTSPRRRDYVDLFLATTIGYGNMGWLVKDWGLDDPFGIETMARSYYMLQQLQQRYAFERPRTIEYADSGGRFLTPSQAHATGAIRDSRLHVVYENGTHVYVNRASAGIWTVKDARGRSVTLPPSGWLAFDAAGSLYEFSALADGRRIDYVQAPEFEFLDGRGAWTAHGNLAASGSVARRVRPGGAIELIDIYGNARIGFQAAGRGTLAAFDENGKNLGTVGTASPRSGWREFTPVAGGRAYVFSAS